VDLDHKEDTANSKKPKQKADKEQATHLWEKTKTAEANQEERMSNLQNEIWELFTLLKNEGIKISL